MHDNILKLLVCLEGLGQLRIAVKCFTGCCLRRERMYGGTGKDKREHLDEILDCTRHRHKEEESVQCLREKEWILLQLNKLAKFQWFQKPNYVLYIEMVWKMSQIKIPGAKERIYVSQYVKDVEHSSNRKIFDTFPDNWNKLSHTGIYVD